MGVERELSVDYFRGLLEKEIKMLTNYCSEWKSILKATLDIPEDIHGDIMVAIGKAELLMKERFSQFRRLIDACEYKQGEKEITCLDLQGFWDIVYIQVEQMTKKFINLEQIKNSGWKDLEHEPPQLIQKKKLAPIKPCSVKAKKGNSALRAHILAARQRMQDEKKPHSSEKLNMDSVVVREVSFDKTIDKKRAHQDDNEKEDSPVKSQEKIVFDAGFFKVETPVKENVVTKDFTPGKPEQKVLASTVLKERVLGSPVTHKDYSSCIRVTRSMKARGMLSRKLDL